MGFYRYDHKPYSSTQCRGFVASDNRWVCSTVFLFILSASNLILSARIAQLSTVSRPQNGELRKSDWNPAEARLFSHQNAHSSSETQPASYSEEIQIYFPGGKVAGV